MADEKTELAKIELPNPKRKITQISTATTNAGRIIVVALCADGTLWRRDAMLDDVEWQQVSGL